MKVAVLVPCFNEEAAIATVVHGFRAALPEAAIYVFDNNSRDATVRAACEAGAEVRHVSRPGKGHVVRRMFADIEADAFILVDGDGTYDPAVAPAMLARLVAGHLDMVIGARASNEPAAFRRGHRLGNRAFAVFLGWLFGSELDDVLSGYRVFSRRFVKSFPALATGFEIETELTVHALELRMPVEEIPTAYKARPDGSQSKLRTYRDGLRILRSIARLYRRERPLAFFGWASVLLAATSVAMAIPLLFTYLGTGLVPRIPTAVLASAIMLVAALCAVCGVVLDTVTLGRQEMKRLAYLNVAEPNR